VRLALFFPSFVDEEDNRVLMVEVTEEQLKEVLHSFHKDKSLGPDGWTIDFSLGFYEIVGTSIPKVVEESHINGHMHAPLNATFIACYHTICTLIKGKVNGKKIGVT
jgi:hypothetical protein